METKGKYFDNNFVLKVKFLGIYLNICYTRMLFKHWHISCQNAHNSIPDTFMLL